jgi:DNA-binding MarR family transcriptional regulator
VPTARGEKVFAEARERLAQTHEVLFAPLTQQERETLLRVLPQLAFPDDIAL